MRNGMIVYCGKKEGFAADQQQYQQALQAVGIQARWLTEDALGMCDIRSLRDDVDWMIVTSGTHPKPYAHDEMSSELLRSFVLGAIEQGISLLGLARGMCAIAASFHAVIEDHSERGEAGVVEINRLAPADGDPLFHDLPEIFRAVAYRNDDMMELPVQLLPMANSRLSQFHIVKVAGKNVYGLQFDPLLSTLSEELSAEERDRMQQVFIQWMNG